MKRQTYLEGLLTINAMLLGGILLINLTGSDGFSPQAVAQSGPAGFPNAAAQRSEMIRAMNAMSEDMRTLTKDLKEIEWKVRVVSMPMNSGSRNASDESDSDREHNPAQITHISTVSSGDSK